MENICPYFRKTQDKHRIKMSAAMEHLMCCEERIRPCDVPLCTFHGNSEEMEVHAKNSLAHHNLLLVKSHEELLYQIKFKSADAGKRYVPRPCGMWSTCWTIDNLALHMRRSQCVSLRSPLFEKMGQVWRLMLLLNSSLEVHLELFSSKQPVDVLLTFSVENNVYDTIRDVIEEGEAMGRTIDINNLKSVDIHVAVTIVKYQKIKTESNKTSAVNKKRDNEADQTGTERIEEFIDSLVKEGKLDRILKEADAVARKLPKTFGRGGNIGMASLKGLNVSIREVFEARIQAPDTLADEVDDIVIKRFMTHDRTHPDNLYSLANDSKDTGLNLRLYGNKSSYISGSIIKLMSENNITL